MFDERLGTCPRCGATMEHGFSASAVGLSWISADSLRQFAFVDKDLNEAGWKKYLPSKAEYTMSHRCIECGIVTVDYGTRLSSKEAKALAQTM